MKVLNSLVSAFLMYSKIPMPQVEWKEGNRRYALCFFPFVGAVVGVLFLLWQFVCGWLEIGFFLKSIGSVLIPLLVTGGIHVDGYCDVIDAKSSYADRETKLKIMSDPHVGSFAVMGLVGYFLLQTALFSETDHTDTTLLIAYGYILSRALSGIAAVTFKSAKNGGTLQSFAKPAHKKVTLIVLSCITAAVCGAMLLTNPLTGGIVLLGAGGSLLYYRIYAYKNFGGITGDLAGWFLQICEMGILILAVIGEKVTEVTAL